MKPLWTRLRRDIHTDPKVLRIAALIAPRLGRYAFASPSADLLGACPQLSDMLLRDVVVAALHRVWSGVASHVATCCETCCIRPCNVSYIDTLAGIDGFGEAMCNVGWLEWDIETNSITLPNWHEFNSRGRPKNPESPAKSSTERSREYRARQKERSEPTPDATQRNAVATPLHGATSRDETRNATATNAQSKEIENSTTTTTPACAKLEDALSYAEEQRRSDLTGKPITAEIARAWFDDRTAAGWVERRDGHEYIIRDWRANLRKYARVWWQRENSPQPTGDKSTHSTTPKLNTPPKGGW